MQRTTASEKKAVEQEQKKKVTPPLYGAAKALTAQETKRPRRLQERGLTQEELLAEARLTELSNKEDVEKLVKLEEDRKRITTKKKP